MMIFKKIVLCILCCLLASFTFAQKLSVTGGKFAEENPTKIILNAVDGKSTKIFMVESVYNTQGTTVVLSENSIKINKQEEVCVIEYSFIFSFNIKSFISLFSGF